MQTSHNEPRTQNALFLLELGSLSLVLWYILSAIATVYFGALSKIPGPKLWAASQIPSQWSVMRGTYHLDLLELHKKYGSPVRIGPNEVAFFTAQSFKDIYAHRPGHKSFVPDRATHQPPPNGVDHIVCAVDDTVHARHRRLLSWAFTEKALKEQEPLIQEYIDLLISRLREQIQSPANGKVDIKSWFNFVTFDIMGDLVFGESFNCLTDSVLHPWIGIIFDSIKVVCLIGAANHFPLIKTLLNWLIPKSLHQKAVDHLDLAAQKVDRRIALQTERPDVMTFVLRNGMTEKSLESAPEKGNVLSRAELHSNSKMLIVAGSETSATLLSGAVYFLGTNPTYLREVTTEVRKFFISHDQIALSTVTNLPYLNAVIEETFRLYPPLVTGLTRVTPAGGEFVTGAYIPEKVCDF
ncbi:putative toxin biosynthesis cytochrome p450 [Phaeomoniella chlamydospora]|uniref:Putative toxin biosynthesis cytochrome p450 n=1 Tax=Phaeomoniella chlamydospora TaxID=158046 RepID=A0A0G2ETK8_PHACM|nr:putative toxin biosynthesis cytochrome p450 [Phaeomoniella chlamydospora]